VNLILLESSDFTAPDRVHLGGRRLRHIREIHRASPGDVLRVGQIDGKIGTGRILESDGEALSLEVDLTEEPPAPLPIRLVVALPRPPSLRKVLQQATALGVKDFVLLHTRRVEKSYWSSHALEPDAIRQQLILGLEQAVDTRLPRVTQERRFKPFVEDRLPRLLETSLGLVADPGGSPALPQDSTQAVTLIVGPEGGFVPYELETLSAQGTCSVGLGPRILRVETAVVALLARLAG
jgi:RsmE family RNA methyltransferase